MRQGRDSRWPLRSVYGCGQNLLSLYFCQDRTGVPHTTQESACAEHAYAHTQAATLPPAPSATQHTSRRERTRRPAELRHAANALFIAWRTRRTSIVLRYTRSKPNIAGKRRHVVGRHLGQVGARGLRDGVRALGHALQPVAYALQPGGVRGVERVARDLELALERVLSRCEARAT